MNRAVRAAVRGGFRTGHRSRNRRGSLGRAARMDVRLGCRVWVCLAHWFLLPDPQERQTDGLERPALDGSRRVSTGLDQPGLDYPERARPLAGVVCETRAMVTAG